MPEKLFQQWQPECESIEMAKQYMIDGLPLKTSHFNGCNSDDYFMMPWGVAMNAAIHFEYAEYLESQNKD